MTEENVNLGNVLNDPESSRMRMIQESTQFITNEYFNEQSALGTATTSGVKIGTWLIRLNALVTADKAEWGTYRGENLPFIDERRDQRYRQLAKNIDLAKHPNLAHISMNGNLRILRVAKAKKGTVAEVFNEYKVTLEGDLTTPDALLTFKSDVQAMLSKIKEKESETFKPKTAAKVAKFIETTRQKLIDEIETFVRENKAPDLLNTEPVQKMKILLDELGNILNKLKDNNTKDTL
jgi:hypothetical protein